MVVGAPLIAVLAARVPRRTVLLWLMVAFAVGNIGSALAASYPVLLAARFVSGLPHGAFFGIGAVVAASLVPLHRRTWAVSMMFAGLTVANVIGVPLTTLIGQHLGWQWPFAMVGADRRRDGRGPLVLGAGAAVGRQPRRWAASCARSSASRCGWPCSSAPWASAACSRPTPTSPRR